MKLFRFNPSIRETNKYLSEISEELSRKHGGVSNEEFEKELVAITGIGWKQVKNYKNHPKPTERLKDNAIVLKYVLQKRSQDSGRKAKIAFLYAGIFVIFIYGVFWFVTRPKEIEQFIVHQVPPAAHTIEFKETRVFLKLASRNWLFRLGPISDSKLPLENFVCVQNVGLESKNCSFNEITPEGSFQAYALLDGGIIKRYSVLSFNTDDVEILLEQLSGLLGNKIKNFPDPDKKVDEISVDHFEETIRITGSHTKQGARPYLSVVVSFKN